MRTSALAAPRGIKKRLTQCPASTVWAQSTGRATDNRMRCLWCRPGELAPWTDFESDKFMLTVPTSWVWRMKDPIDLMRRYQLSMDGVSERLGYPPEKRNRHVRIGE